MKNPSFHRVDYSLRPNKSIERKLVFDVLTRLQGSINLPAHRYIGFGSMWFVDFMLAHRKFALDEMWSIERDEPARADFNRPYDAITVKDGAASLILSAITPEEWNRPSTVWLDYDDGINSAAVSDIESVIAKTAPNSVLLVTVNGERDSYRYYPPGCTEHVPQNKTLARAELARALGAEVLASRFLEEGGNPLPSHKDVLINSFPEFLAESLLNLMVHKAVHAQRQVGGQLLTFVPLFNFVHVDGATMVTVGGVLAPENMTQTLKAAAWQASGYYAQSPHFPVHQRFDLPVLTVREKIALDRCLPQPEQDYLDDLNAMGIQLSEGTLKKYRQVYRHFPVFTETVL